MNDLPSWPLEASGAERPAEPFGIYAAFTEDEQGCVYWSDGLHLFAPQMGNNEPRCACGKERPRPIGLPEVMPSG